jgi:hypothetical protein
LEWANDLTIDAEKLCYGLVKIGKIRLCVAVLSESALQAQGHEDKGREAQLEIWRQVPATVRKHTFHGNKSY